MPQIVPFETILWPDWALAADILRRALAHVPSAYGGPGEAEAEVATFVGNPERFALAAFQGIRLVGWIGCVRSYSHAWELHPLVVDPDLHRQGHGRSLVAALEDEVRAAGILTLYLGADDDFGGTSLYGADVFPEPLSHLQAIAPASGHPFTFYRRVGFTEVGLIPDANGRGRPDILMAKRIG